MQPAASRPARKTAPRAVLGHAILQVAMIYRGQIIGYQLLRHRRKVTVGPSKRATFVTPSVTAGGRRLALLVPKRAGYVLRLTPGLTGDLVIGGNTTSVASVLAEPPAGRPSRSKRDLREVTLAAGDRAKLAFAEAPDLRIEVRWVDPPEHVPRPATQDPAIWKTMTGATLVLGAFATLLVLIWQKEPPKTLAINPERMAKLEEPILQIQKAAARREKSEEKKQEEGQMKRAKEKAGRLGRADTKQKDTVIPKGDKDILREKVMNKGLLGLIGKDKPQGSGLSKLFAADSGVEQAMAGMTGAKLVAGRGSGGLSTAGTGPGGGGTGFGHIYGAGNLDTGGRGTHGKGRGPKLAERGEREVSVGMGGGNSEMDGSLSKEQINKVVMAHKSGVKYCYEKELQHKPNLSGNVDVSWTIQPDGTVSKASVKNSSVGDAAVEGCIIRQIKQWQFPKAPAQTIVGRYPFIFKGG